VSPVESRSIGDGLFHGVAKDFGAKVIILQPESEALKLGTEIGTLAAGTSFVRASSIQASRNALTTSYPSLDSLVGGLRGGRSFTIRVTIYISFSASNDDESRVRGFVSKQTGSQFLGFSVL